MEEHSDDLGARLRENARVLRERKWLIALCALLTAAAAYAYSASQTEQYRSTSRLIVETNDLGGAITGFDGNSTLDPERESATNLELVAQPALAASVIKELRLDMTPDELLGNVEGRAEGNSRLVAIDVTDESPREAARIANAYAEEYIAFRAATDRTRVRRALVAVRDQLAAARRRDNAPGRREARRLRRQVEELQLLSSLQTGNAEVVQRARVPGSSVSPKPVRNTILGFLFGLLLGVGLAFLRDRLDPRLKREADVREILPGVPTVATIPRGGGHRRGALEAEAFRGLQSRLTSLDPGNRLRSLLVTSASVGEGKSATSLNLALAMAERDQSVILVEADLRRRGLSERLGLTRFSGLSNLLSGEGSLEEYLIEASLDGRASSDGSQAVDPRLAGIVSVVPAGPVPRNPHALLSGRAFEKLLDDAGRLADKVVVDGTPVGLMSDALPIAQQVDGVIVIARLYQTRRNELQRLADQFTQAHVRPFGIVLFGVGRDTLYDTYL